MLSRKDRSPEATIARARDLLAQLGLHAFEEGWYSFSPHCQSVRLEIISLPGIGSNGKGASKTLALASAYAELLERLQNRALMPPGINFGLMKDFDQLFPDQREVGTEELLMTQQGILGALFRKDPEDLRLPDQKHILVPYYRVDTKTISYLPWNYLRRACASNGMCAGNTPEEALAQGLCEIAERYVRSRLFYDAGLRLPVIPHSELEGLEVKSIVDEVVSAGYGLIIKDCTLGGVLPVLGVILIDRENGKYGYCVGADPNFQLALQRCLTELFQGRKAGAAIHPLFQLVDDPFLHGPFESYQRNLDMAFMLVGRGGAGELPNRAFLEVEEVSQVYRNAFDNEGGANLGALRWALRSIQKVAKDIYVRDVSYLGFPSFHVYVPGISELYRLVPEELHFHGVQSTLRETLLRLEDSSVEEIRRLALDLEGRVSSGVYFHGAPDWMSTATGTIMGEGSGLAELISVQLLLGMLFGRVGDSERAYYWLARWLREKGNRMSTDAYTLCVVSYFRLKGEKASNAHIKLNLSSVFGDELCKEVLGDLNDPSKMFQYLRLPRCGDCSRCPVEPDCYYPAWRDCTTRLMEKMAANPINQGGLERLFGSLG